MFDNGSFLRRRRRFKKMELRPNFTTKLTDALKNLDKFGQEQTELNCLGQLNTIEIASSDEIDNNNIININNIKQMDPFEVQHFNCFADEAGGDESLEKRDSINLKDNAHGLFADGILCASQYNKYL